MIPQAIYIKLSFADFISKCFFVIIVKLPKNARVVELVDTLALGASAARREGSIPFIPTIQAVELIRMILLMLLLLVVTKQMGATKEHE